MIEAALEYEAADLSMLERHAAAMQCVRDGEDGWEMLQMVICPSPAFERASRVKARSKVVTLDELLAGG